MTLGVSLHAGDVVGRRASRGRVDALDIVVNLTREITADPIDERLVRGGLRLRVYDVEGKTAFKIVELSL